MISLFELFATIIFLGMIITLKQVAIRTKRQYMSSYYYKNHSSDSNKTNEDGTDNFKV